MSSTFLHYGTPASLPSDYAILTRYAASQHNGALQVNERPESEDDNLGGQEHTRPCSPRRRSLPSSYFRSRSITIGAPIVKNSLSVIQTEITPLLRGSTVPVIQESVGRTDGHEETTMAMFWEELYVLTRYTVPVFG